MFINVTKGIVIVKKKSTLLAVGAASVLVGLASVGVVSAATSTTNPQDSLVTQIADKFHLNKTDVQKVFDDHHEQMESKRESDVKSRLDQAVKDKKITQEQEDKIIAKLKELKSQHEADREAMKNKTPEERKAAMEAKRTELEKWAKDNNIPTEYLRHMGGHGPHGHMHGDMGPAPDTQQ